MFQIRTSVLLRLFLNHINETIHGPYLWTGLRKNHLLLTNSRSFSRRIRNNVNSFRPSNLIGTLWYCPPHRDKSLPRLLYIQYPWKYLLVKLRFIWFKLFWDRSFKEEDFMFGSKMAAVVIPNLLRGQNLDAIRKLTTESGFKQITSDIQKSSEEDPRLKMLKFRVSDIIQAIPVKAELIKRDGRKYCIVDMFFVGMRNIRDFDHAERAEIHEYVRKYDATGWKTEDEIIPGSKFANKKGKRRVLFAEILTRFCREYGKDEKGDWSVAFYKISTFDVLAF